MVCSLLALGVCPKLIFRGVSRLPLEPTNHYPVKVKQMFGMIYARRLSQLVISFKKSYLKLVAVRAGRLNMATLGSECGQSHLATVHAILLGCLLTRCH